MFEGFAHKRIKTSGTEIALAQGGDDGKHAKAIKGLVDMALGADPQKT